ncbi:MAG: sensor histidine kinase [Bacteroidota bacterium]
MSHPITGRRSSLLIYTGVWMLLMMLQTGLLSYYVGLPFSLAATDSITGNILYALMGILAWYPTRYIPYRKNGFFYYLSAHVAAGLAVITLWLLLSTGFTMLIAGSSEEYDRFINDSWVWRVVYGVLIYLVLILIYYLVIYARTIQERAQQEERLRSLVRETELNLLKSQINPHFLFNSLNSISSLTMSNPEEAREMIIRLSDFLRYSLKNRESEYVPMQEEIGRMKDYLAIEKIRFGEKLRYEMDVETECLELLVPTMILQPLIENAIKHGVYESLEPVTIRLTCHAGPEKMRISLSNNFDPTVPSRKGTGVGLQNVTQRIRLAYGDEGRAEWSLKDNVFTVNLIIPRKRK